MQIARTCHEVNKAFCESIGDFSQPSWKDAPEWQKKSTINGVHFVLDNPYARSSDNHNNWMKEKEREGWVYGEEKNEELKTHPCIVPYDRLPAEQQAKDSLFIATVRSFL